MLSSFLYSLSALICLPSLAYCTTPWPHQSQTTPLVPNRLRTRCIISIYFCLHYIRSVLPTISQHEIEASQSVHESHTRSLETRIATVFRPLLYSTTCTPIQIHVILGRSLANLREPVVQSFSILEVEGYRIDAVPFVSGRREAFSLEDVAQMSAACRADDLGAHSTERDVLMAGDCTRNGVEECGPTAATVELGHALVQGGSASSAGVNALALEMVILSGACGLCVFLSQDSELLRRQNGPPLGLTLRFAGAAHGSEFRV